MFLLGQFPNNMALKKIAQKRMLESVDLSPEEQRQVETAEEEQVNNPAESIVPQENPQLINDINQKMQLLQA